MCGQRDIGILCGKKRRTFLGVAPGERTHTHTTHCAIGLRDCENTHELDTEKGETSGANAKKWNRKQNI